MMAHSMVENLAQTRCEKTHNNYIMLALLKLPYYVQQQVEYDMETYGCPIAIPYTQHFRPTLELCVACNKCSNTGSS